MKNHKPKASAAAKAFTSSENHKLGDMNLQPWTPQRIVAAQSIGMIYPFIGSDGLEQFKKSGTYPGLLKDAIIALWLCTINHEDVDAAEGSPREAYRQAVAWAADKNIPNMESKEFNEAHNIFIKMMNQVRDSQTKPEETSNNSEESEFPKD